MIFAFVISCHGVGKSLLCFIDKVLPTTVLAVTISSAVKVAFSSFSLLLLFAAVHVYSVPLSYLSKLLLLLQENKPRYSRLESLQKSSQRLPHQKTKTGKQAASSVLTAVSEGELTPIEATRVMGLIDSYRCTLELTEIEKRLQVLEQA